MDTNLTEDSKHENIDISFASTVGIHIGTSLAKVKIKIETFRLVTHHTSISARLNELMSYHSTQNGVGILSRSNLG